MVDKVRTYETDSVHTYTVYDGPTPLYFALLNGHRISILCIASQTCVVYD
jgi:hypothetical protein